MLPRESRRKEAQDSPTPRSRLAWAAGLHSGEVQVALRPVHRARDREWRASLPERGTVSSLEPERQAQTRRRAGKACNQLDCRGPQCRLRGVDRALAADDHQGTWRPTCRRTQAPMARAPRPAPRHHEKRTADYGSKAQQLGRGELLVEEDGRERHHNDRSAVVGEMQCLRQ